MGNEQSKSKDLTQNGSIPEKQENGSVNGITANTTSNGLETDVKSTVIVQQNGKPLSLTVYTESSEPDTVVVQTNYQPVEAQVVSKTPEPISLKEVTKKEKVTIFGNIFKKKADDDKNQRQDASNEELTNTVDPQFEANQLQQTESLTDPQSVTVVLSPAEEKAPGTDNSSSELLENQQQSNPEENPVMNFFKTLVTPTKTSKKETATPDASKDQSQKETQQAAAITVAQVAESPAAPKGMSIPPPPPPEPPKMEIKGEPAAKSVKPAPKQEPKAAAKEPESSKAKLAKDSFSKLFRPKRLDPSKASTLEAAAKPEPPPPVQEEKKPASKSPFTLFFKPKAGHSKKATSTPTTTAEATQPAKAKEEPKTAAKSSEAVVENKPSSVVTQAGDTGASVPKKLEKRNSIQLFFKNLGQKRNSTDAGVQTEPVTVAPAAEKAK